MFIFMFSFWDNEISIYIINILLFILFIHYIMSMIINFS